MTRNYTEFSRLATIEERLEYLSLGGRVGDITFGHERRFNQDFYRSSQWKRVRRHVILRDENCDLAMPGFEIYSAPHIHHMVPITMRDLVNRNPAILDPEFLITVSQSTHNAIHYGTKSYLPRGLIERRPNDHIPWKK